MKIIRLACCAGLAAALGAPNVLLAQAAVQVPPPPLVLPSTIPLFPLPDVVLFPHVSRPLLVFEPRYREMVADALKGDGVIGMVLLRPGYEANYEGRPPIYGIGCAGVLSEVEQLADGRYRIVLSGFSKFRIVSEDQSRLYRLARVEALPDEIREEDRAILGTRRERLVDLFVSFVAPGADPPPAAMSDEAVVNALAQVLDIEPGQRQNLLEVNGPLLRSGALIELLEQP